MENSYLWKLKRPPLFRLCTLNHSCTSWPDEGQGVWQIMGYEGIDTVREVFTLRRIMPSTLGGSSGETLKIHRMTHETGGLRIWKKELEDPVYNLSNN